jgi:hypothetical protein
VTQTVQLRQYQVVDGMMPDFLQWFDEHLVPLREQRGYTIEFVYVVEATNEVVWAISYAGDAAAFAAAEADFAASTELAIARAGIPKRVASTRLHIVQPRR